MNPLRVCAVAAAGLLLSACGSISPGAAAMVDGQAISMSKLDETARVYCEVTAQSAQQQGVQAIDNADMRRQAVLDLAMERVATDIAEERGLKIPGPVENDTDQLVEVFGADRAPEIATTLGEAQRLFKLFAVIGGNRSVEAVTDDNAAELAEIGRNVVLAQFPEHDVTFSPRLGLDDSGDPNNDIGSLSVAPIDFESPTPEELPGPLACRA